MSYSEIENIIISAVIDDEFNDIRLVARLESAAHQVYVALLDRELSERKGNDIS